MAVSNLRVVRGATRIEGVHCDVGAIREELALLARRSPRCWCFVDPTLAAIGLANSRRGSRWYCSCCLFKTPGERLAVRTLPQSLQGGLKSVRHPIISIFG